MASQILMALESWPVFYLINQIVNYEEFKLCLNHPGTAIPVAHACDGYFYLKNAKFIKDFGPWKKDYIARSLLFDGTNCEIVEWNPDIEDSPPINSCSFELYAP